MGSSADATLFFGIAWPAEEGPPAWRDAEESSYYSLDYAKLDPEEEEDPEDEDAIYERDPGETLARILEPYPLLEEVYHGVEDYHGFGISVKRLNHRVMWGGVMRNVGRVTLDEPTPEEWDQLRAVGAELGFDIGECGWTLVVDYG